MRQPKNRARCTDPRTGLHAGIVDAVRLYVDVHFYVSEVVTGGLQALQGVLYSDYAKYGFFRLQQQVSKRLHAVVSTVRAAFRGLVVFTSQFHSARGSFHGEAKRIWRLSGT